MTRVYVVLIALLVGPQCLLAQEKALPPKIVSSWEMVHGVHAGWLGPRKGITSLQMIFAVDKRVERENLDLARSVPSFFIAEWKPGLLDGLPGPEQPFGLVLARKSSDEQIKELASLKQFKHLIALDLTYSGITDKGMKELARFERLKALKLRNVSAVTQAGITELAGLKELSVLELQYTKVNDLWLNDLGKLKQLRTLDLWQTQVTDAGAAGLRMALPQCKIIHEHKK